MEKKKKRMHSGKKARNNKRLVILSGAVAAGAIVFVIGILIYVIFGMQPVKQEEEQDIMKQIVELNKYLILGNTDMVG